MIFRLLLVLSMLAAWAAPGLAQRPPSPPPSPPPTWPTPPPMRRVPPPIVAPTPGEPEWPPRMMIKPLTPPNVSNADNYPAAARRNEEEGLVVFELLVARNGTPRACRTWRSSGFAALDIGTCDLAMRLRFAPPLDSSGGHVEATFRGQIMWQLAPHPVPLAPTGITASLTIRDGLIASCDIAGEGPLFGVWRRSACLMIRAERKYYLGDRDVASGRAEVTVRLFPTGQDPAATAPPAVQPAASQRIDFSLERDGDISGCRTVRNRGFGTLRVDGRYPCGNFFLSQAWFDKARGEAPARTGAIEIQVLVTQAE